MALFSIKQFKKSRLKDVKYVLDNRGVLVLSLPKDVCGNILLNTQGIM